MKDASAAGQTFVEEHHDLLKRLHEVDVVVAVLLDLQQQADLGQTLGGEGFQQRAVLLQVPRETAQSSTQQNSELTLYLKHPSLVFTFWQHLES